MALVSPPFREYPQWENGAPAVFPVAALEFDKIGRALGATAAMIQKYPL